MSHHLHNPFDSRNQSSTQGQYGFSSAQADRDPGMASSYLGPGSSFSSSGASSAIPDNTGGIFSSPMSQSMNYGSEQSRALMDENIEKSIEMHISRAREESRFGKPMHQPIDEGTHCTGLQRDEFRSSDTRMASHPMSSASASLGQSDVGSGRSSLDWLSNYKKPTTDDSKFYSSSEHDMQSIPGLGDYDCPVPDKPAESSQPKYTSESATNILQRFGLEKEDLEHLIAYPDDQMTPENLPFILRQIRIQKAKRATTACQSKPYPDPQPTRSVGQMDNHSLSTSWGSGMRQEEISSAVLQPSKVIDYGHTGKYTGGVGDDIGTTRCSRANSGGGGGMLLMDTCDSSKNIRGPLQKHTTEVKSSSLGSSRQQTSSVTSLSSSNGSALKYVAPPSHDQTKRLQTEPNQTSQTILSLFSVPKKDTDLRVVKTEASKPVPLKEPTSDRQSTSKTQPPTNLLRGVHPGRPGLVLIGSNNNSGTKDQSKTRIQGSTVAQQTKKQQTQQQSQKQPVEQQSKQQKEQKQKGQVMWPPFSVAKSVPSAAVIPSIIDASKAMQHPMFIPGDPRPIVIPPVLPQQISAQMSFNHTTLPTSHWQPPAKVAVFKGLPTLAMMQDYAAASPRIFPHTCSLCNKECTQMKDWVSHQNTSHHLESCTLLRKQYPDWDGEIALGPRAVGKDAKPSTSTSAPTPQHRHKKTRHGSRSRSRSSSPRYHHGSERRREKRSSRSRSPHGSRYTRRSRSRSRSPWYDRPTSFHYRSRSRSSERRSSPRRRDERRSSPRGSHERQLSPWRYDGRLSPPRRIDSRRSPPRRNRESQSSAEGRLAQKLLETSAVQSLSTQSDLEAVVKTLAPALLAELAKMKSSSSSSSSSAKKKWTTKPSKGKPGLQSSEASSATTTKTGKSSPPTMVRLEGINSSLSHNDVVTAVEQFGKTKSVVLFRTKLQAIVCFEKEEDAKKMKSVKSFDVKGLTINVVREEETVSNVQKKPPQKKPAMSITTTFTSRTVLLPTPNVPSLSCSPKPSPSGAQTATTGKLTNQKIAATTGVETAEPMEVGSGAHGKGERPSTTGDVPENSEDKPCGIRPATSETLSTEMKQNDPVTAVNTQMDAASADLTVGEMLEEHLFLHMIPSFDRKFFFSPNFFRLDKKQLLLSGLPTYYDGCYTEDDVAKLLIPFGLRYNYSNNNNIFVIPQTGMAFVRMPSAATVRNVLNAFKTDPFILKWSTLCCRVLSTIDMSPSGFYKRLMEMLKSPVVDDGLRTFFINNVSPRCTRDLRKAMKRTFSVKNYLPLLNKMFIEFETVQDADRFQVWYSLFKQGPGHKVQRLKMPNSSCTSLNAAAAAKDESVTTEPKGAAVSEQQLATSTLPSTAVTSLTIGEMLEKHLDISKIVRLKSRNYLSPKYSKHGLKQLMITRLPKYYDGCYTEEDIVKLLIPFGFEYTDNSIYILPQMCMALFQMPTAAHVRAIMSGCTQKRTSLKGSKLFFDVVAGGIAMTPLGFYKSVMKLVRFSVHDNGARTVLISDVSPSEARDLKETFKTFGHIRNYLPLINKLFVEFENAADANRIVAWFGLLKQDPGFKVHGLQKPSKHRSFTTQDPVTAVKTQWDAESNQGSSTGAEMIKQQPATSTPSSTAVPLLTPEEMVEKHMYQDGRVSFSRENYTPPKVDFTDDSVSSSLPIACLFDERNSIMNDSVTDDTFNDDVKDSSPEPHGSFSSSRARLERQSSGMPPASEQLSPSVGEPSSFSSPLSTETSNSPGQKMQQSGTKSPAKASNTTSSGCSTRSSSAEREKEKLTTTPPVKASIQTHLESLGEEAKATEGAVAKSDHRVSAEGSAAKTDESEKKVETSSEMHPPSQGHGDELTQTQSLEIDVNVNTPKDQRKSKEEGNEEDVDKHTEEEEDDVENYLILDSLDDQTDKQMDDGDRGCSSETHPAVPEEDQTLHEKSYQVLDSVNGEGRARPEDDSEMEMDGSFKVLDSVTEDQAATGEEDSHLVQDDGSTVKGLSEEAAGPVVDKSHEKSTVKDAVEDSKDMENPVVDEPFQGSDNKDNLKDPDNEDTEQETFEILDSIDDQTATEDDSQQTGSDQISKEDICPIEQEEDTFQVIDSLEDQPTTTENEPETDNKEKRTRKGEATARKDGPSRRSGRTATASKTEEKEKSPKKQDRAVRKYETRTKMDTTAGVSKKDKEIKEATEEMMYEIVDSVEDKPIQEAITSERPGRRRSARGKKTEASERPDSVEEENTNDEPTVTTRSTRGRERASKKDASNEKTNKEDTPTRRRHTPARESQEQREKTPKKEEKASPKGSTPTKKSDIVVREVSKSDPTYDIVESAKVVKDDRPATGQKGRRGRPKKEVKKEKDNITLKKGDGDTSEKMAEEEEATYQILDSVEDETVDDQSPTGQLESLRKESITKNDDEQTKNSASLPGSPRNEEEEEPVYQIVDSLEDDEIELTATEVSDKGGKENSNNEAKEGESTEKGETATRGTKALEGSEKILIKEDSMYELVEDLEDVHVDPPATEDDSRNEERTTQTDIKKDSKSPTKSQSDTETPEVKNKQKTPEKSDTTSTLVNLDEVSEEEFPDDTAEEEELRKRQAATKEKQIAKEGRGTREREEREQRSWGSSRGGVSSGGRTRRSKERWRENEEKVEFDTKELVKLDEVGADEAGEERALESQDRDVEFLEGELQTFVTLDEFVEEEEEEEEDVKAVQTLPETCPLLQEDESVDSLNPETLVTLDEAGGDEEEKPDEEQAEKTSTSAKREHDDDTEECMNFVTVDEVGEVEEEEEEKEVVTTRTRGRAKKRNRQTPVRKSTRGKKEERDEEKEAVDVLPSLSTSSSIHKDPSTLSSDGPPEVQKREEEVEAARQADIDAACAGQETQPEHPEDQTLEECVEEGEEEKEGWSRADIKAVRKRKRELVGPEAKRARSRSPCVAADFKLLAFKPNNPLGQEFVVPKSGYFCNLCSVFYLNESTAKDAHCSSRRHFDNLKKHYQKLEQEPS